MLIARDDKKHKKIENELALTNEKLKHQYEKIKNETKSNPMLKSVLDQYEKYNKNIINTKKSQHDALNKIYNYLEKLLEVTTLSNQNQAVAIKLIKQDIKNTLKIINLLNKELE